MYEVSKLRKCKNIKDNGHVYEVYEGEYKGLTFKILVNAKSQDDWEITYYKDGVQITGCECEKWCLIDVYELDDIITECGEKAISRMNEKV